MVSGHGAKRWAPADSHFVYRHATERNKAYAVTRATDCKTLASLAKAQKTQPSRLAALSDCR